MSAKPSASFGELVRQLRLARGWEQKQLAREAGISRPYLSELENNKHPRPGDDVLMKLAMALQVPFATLADAPKRVGMSDSVSGIVTVSRETHSELEEVDILDGVGAARSFSDLEDQGSVVGSQLPPPGYEDRIGPNGKGFVVRGESMAGWERRPIHDGDIAWVSPSDRSRRRGVVVAIVREAEESEPKYVIKWHDGEGGLWSFRAGGDKERFHVAEILDMTPVIVLTSPPGEP